MLTLLAHFTGAADWISVMFYSITIIYANVLLPAPRGRWVTLIATVSFSLLVLLEYTGRLRHQILFSGGASYDRGSFVLATVFVGAVIGFSLIGYTSSQFSRMLTSKAEALERQPRTEARQQRVTPA
jgi:hypothetical protein